MNGDWAAQNLQTIRTLMERGAVYRRALAPIMIAVGCIGLGAAVLGWQLELTEPRKFILYWLAVAAVACAVGFVLVRRQALTAGEPIWSPPARRVMQAAQPSLTAGLLLGLAVVWLLPQLAAVQPELAADVGLRWLPLGWIVLYGCAMHAAGFFLPRGMRLFGWAFIISGFLLFATGALRLPANMLAHGVMGFFFGILHQAYGVYLYLTETKETSA